MTTITTMTATLDAKHPAVYEQVFIEQRENVSGRITHQTQTQTQTHPQAIQTPSSRQRALLVHAAQQPYAVVNDHAIPSILHKDEILIKVPPTLYIHKQ